MPFIQVIQHDRAEGLLKDIYDDLVAKRGKLAEVHKIQSLNPASITVHMDLYMLIMFGKSPLRRYQREMIGVIVSKSNRCQYCVKHHAEALLHFWKDEQRIQLLLEDIHQASLKVKDILLCQLAEILTLDPSYPNKEKLIKKLKEAELSDRAILDAHLIISYFNFVNRMVLGLGVDLEEDGGIGYNYD